MDIKEQFLIDRTRAVLESGTFSERDVLSLLILLREHAPDKSLLREFGDFVAHRERDRGLLCEYLGRVQAALMTNTAVVNQTDPFRVIKSSEICQSFNDLFASLGMPLFDPELGNRVSACIITILQSVRVSPAASNPALVFMVQMFTFAIALIGVVQTPAGHGIGFPLLVADNNGYEQSLTIAPPIESLMGGDFLVEAQCQNGTFTVEQRERRA